MRLALVFAAVALGLLLAPSLCAADTHAWLQAPDLVGGIAYSSQINCPSTAADDFQFAGEGPFVVPSISWYGAYWKPFAAGDFAPNSASFANADYGDMAGFTISIWDNVPAVSDLPFDHPGTAIWTYQTGKDFTEIFAGPTSAGRDVYSYSVDIPTADQQIFEAADGQKYWLSIEATLQNPQGRPETARQWGWLESANDDHNMAGAVQDFKDSEWFTLRNNLYSSNIAFTIQEASAIPEPGTLCCLALGSVGLLGIVSRIRRRR